VGQDNLMITMRLSVLPLSGAGFGEAAWIGFCAVHNPDLGIRTVRRIADRHSRDLPAVALLLRQ
jgi:hypothetical protein